MADLKDRPSPQADLTARFQERVSEMTASGEIPNADALTAPAPTVDSGASAPAVATPDAGSPPPVVTPATPAKKDAIPPSGAHAPDDASAPSTGAAATAIAAAMPASPADVVLGTSPVSAAGSAPSGAAATSSPAAAAGAAAPVAATADQSAATAPAAPPDTLDWEDVTVESGIPDVSYKLRVPKDQVDQVKRGFLREADYTRKTMAFGKHRDFLTRLITPDPSQGNRNAMDVLQPILERAFTDNVFGSRVTELYNRILQGRPVYFSDEIAPGAAAPAGGPAAPAATPAGEITLESLGFDAADPWLEGQLPALNNLVKTLNAQQTYISTQMQRDQVNQTATQQQQQLREQGNAARRFVESKYPGEYDGPEGEQRMIGLFNYATQHGYIEGTGSIAGGMLAARVDLDRARSAAQQQQVGSAAARSLAQVEAEAQALAQRSAAHVAATVGPPNGATSPPAALATKPALRNADGSRRNPKTIVAEAAAMALAGQTR